MGTIKTIMILSSIVCLSILCFREGYRNLVTEPESLAKITRDLDEYIATMKLRQKEFDKLYPKPTYGVGPERDI